MNNALLAKVLYTNKLATRAQIEQYWSQISTERNLASLLLEAGIITSSVHAQVVEFVAGMEAPAAVAESSGEPELAQLVPGGNHDAPGMENAVLNVEGNNLYGSHAGQGQAVPAVDGLESSLLVKGSDGNRGTNEEASEQTLPLSYTLFRGDENSDERIPHPLTPSASLSQLVAFARQQNASDIYLQPESPVLLRRHGQLFMASEIPLTLHDVERWIGESAQGHSQNRAPAKGSSTCYAIGLPGAGRIRITLEWCQDRPLLSVKPIPLQGLSFQETGIPEFASQWSGNGGLILIAGSAASGKTTSLCALGEQLASQRSILLQTLENPIEHILESTKGLVIQKEVGTHVLTALDGLKAALEESPDVLLFDGLHDHLEFRELLQVAGSGVLVAATTTGSNALGLLQHLLESAPDMLQEELRNQLAELLKCVICQHLIPAQDGKGMILAVEAFRTTPGIASMIRKNDLQQIPAAIAGLKHQGIALDDSLQSLVENNLIPGSEAWSRALDPRRFQQYRPQFRKK